jgi:ATP diphosphatase
LEHPEAARFLFEVCRMSHEIDRLIALMERLRRPGDGCPWDLEQDFKTLAPGTLEEAYEVLEAAEKDDAPHLCEELGDLLLHVVFHAQIARERGLFTIDDVARRETDKMIDRHPHVFGARDNVRSADDVVVNWEADKAEKRAAANARASALDGVNTAMPAIARAEKLQKRAARVGFDWTDPADIFAKIDEELAEVKAELPAALPDRLEDEVGDVLFVVVNLARRLNVDPERALRRANRKFETRFRAVETRLAQQGKTPDAVSLDALEELWTIVKKDEKLEKSA